MRDPVSAPSWQVYAMVVGVRRAPAVRPSYEGGSIAAEAEPMIPISDENPTLRTPLMTWLILGAIFAVWFVVQGGGLPGNDLQLATSVCNLGMIPGELTGRAPVGEGFWI